MTEETKTGIKKELKKEAQREKLKGERKDKNCRVGAGFIHCREWTNISIH